MWYHVLYFVALASLNTASAQFPPQPEGIIFRHVASRPNVSISYKETHICETQSRAWAGYVHTPVSYLADIETDEPYTVNLFFWYFEARSDPTHAPTAIYLAGGPGEPSVSGAVSDGGPCTVLPDSNTTASNPWSWNTHVNVLYIDQPVSTGFSYTRRINSTLDLLFLGFPFTETGITPFDAYDGFVPPQNETFLWGTFSEQSILKTANSTLTAAKTLWHFSQAWFSSFPEYETTNKDISIFGNSYGGFYVPVTAEYFVQQNHRIRKRDIEGIHLPIHGVGWTNGCVDMLVQAEWYPDQAYNNTYGLQVIPEDVYLDAKRNFTQPGGCSDLINECRELGDRYDPDYLSINSTVNHMCVLAEQYCFEYVMGAYDASSNRSDFDMAHLKPDPWPTSYWYAFFNQHWVQKELGVPVNLSTVSILDNNVFTYQTGDPVRIKGLQSVNYLLEQNIKVSMIYGDRDYRCPWNGGEKLSLAASWLGGDKFRQAGYSYVQTNSSYRGGMVRQHGNLSFTRVFDAGHDAQAYQPETVFHLFNRAIFNKDLATGSLSTAGANNNYSTSGPPSTFAVKNRLPPPPAWNCNLYNVISSCTLEQYEALRNGTADIINFTVVNPAGGSPGTLTGLI